MPSQKTYKVRVYTEKEMTKDEYVDHLTKERDLYKRLGLDASIKLSAYTVKKKEEIEKYKAKAEQAQKLINEIRGLPKAVYAKSPKGTSSGGDGLSW